MKIKSLSNSEHLKSHTDSLIDSDTTDKILYVFFFFGCLAAGFIYLQAPANIELAYLVDVTCLVVIACAIHIKKYSKFFIFLLNALFLIFLVALVYWNGIVPTPLGAIAAILPLLLLPMRVGSFLSLVIALSPFTLLLFRPEEATAVFSRIMAVNICLALLMIVLVHRVRVVTERYKRAEKSAVEASMAKSQFLANMSHEIRTPLNGIFGSLQIIRSHLDDSSTVGRYTGVAMQSYHSVIGIVNDILDLSKLTENKVDIYPEPSNVGEIVELVTTELKALTLNKGVDLIGVCATEVDAQNRLIDRTRLTQVLRNFLSNAIKFTDTGSVKIEARLGAHSDEVIFTISDTGVGIPEDKLEKSLSLSNRATLPVKLSALVQGSGSPYARHWLS